MRLRVGDDTRPRVVGVAVGLIALSLVGVYLAIFTHPVGIFSYEQRGTVLSLVYAPSGACGQIFGVRVRESAERVTVHMWELELPVVLPTNASQPLCNLSLELDEPLGDRELWIAGSDVSVEEQWRQWGR